MIRHKKTGLIVMAVALSTIGTGTGAFASDNQCFGKVGAVGAGEGGYCVQVNATGGTCPAAACGNRLCVTETTPYYREMVAGILLALAGGNTIALGWNNASPC